MMCKEETPHFRRARWIVPLLAAGLAGCATSVPAPVARQVGTAPAPQAIVPTPPTTVAGPASPACVAPTSFPNFPEQYQGAMHEIVCHLEQVDGLPAEYVTSAIAQARFNARAVALMTPPPPSPGPAQPYPWWRYRDRFLSPARLERGLQFWREHSEAVAAASRQYGVPGPVLLSILNIETTFGTYQGSFPVLDTNLSLALALPGRERFFRHQLAEYLRLCRQIGLDPSVPRGSPAGAMGMSQFLASSYLRYAVPLNDPPGDPAPVDLWRSVPDVLASTANFFRAHGWQPGAPVLVPASCAPGSDPNRFKGGAKPRFTLSQLAAAGITPAEDPVVPKDTAVGLVALSGRDGTEYYIAYPNFYVIMRYNPSTYYASAVWAYAQALAAQGERLAMANP